MAMSPEKAKLLLGAYRVTLDKICPGVEARQMCEEDTMVVAHELKSKTRVAHYKFMCDKIQRLVDAGSMEKAMRWLGFLQGVMWRRNLYTLNELKDHSTKLC